MASAALIAGRFRERFGREPVVVASAPGRVNLVGEHTDYNEGFVLPLAIDRRLAVALAPVTGGHTEVVSAKRDAGTTSYVEAMREVLAENGITVPPVQMVVAGELPMAAGLSSSAALEIAALRAFAALVGHDWNGAEMARIAQQGENDVLGVRSGIMDQMAIALGRPGTAMLLDCRSLEATYVPIPPELAVVVMDTGMRRRLSGSEYNDRRGSCEEVVEALRQRNPSIRALRDVSPRMLDESVALLDATQLARARHVVLESARPAEMVQALAQRDFARVGEIADASHASLRDSYAVSSTHLDVICEVARTHPACYGARMTGAGFGGCAIAFVHADAVDNFIRHAQPQYEARTYQRSAFFRALPSEGVRLES